MIRCGAEVDALVIRCAHFINQLMSSVQDKDGYTPLHIAAGYLHERVISLLMRFGADPSLEDNTGRSVRLCWIPFCTISF